MLVGVVITFAAPALSSLIPIMGVIFPLTSSAMIGAPLVILIIIVVSLLTEPPPERIRRLLAEQVHGHLD
jgi:cation/acetate symporter